MKLNRFNASTICATLCAALLAINSSAWEGGAGKLVAAVQSTLGVTSSTAMPAVGSVEVAFSPNVGAEALVLKVIASGNRDVRLLGYSFTSAPVTQALLAAKKRGAVVTVVVDHKANVSNDPSGKARAALSALATAGIDVRTVSTYPIHHDKVILVDGVTVQTGSFNYSAAAASKNSENVLVNWDNPKLVAAYAAHFQRNYRQSVPYKTQY